MINILAQLPTPTPWNFPTGTPAVNIDYSSWSIWAFTDEAINSWNRYPDLGPVIRYAVILVIIISFASILMVYLKNNTEKTDD